MLYVVALLSSWFLVEFYTSLAVVKIPTAWKIFGYILLIYYCKHGVIEL